MDDKVSPPGGVLGRGESLPLDALRRRRPHHLLREVQRDPLVAQQHRNLDPRPAQRLQSNDIEIEVAEFKFEVCSDLRDHMEADTAS